MAPRSSKTRSAAAGTAPTDAAATDARAPAEPLQLDHEAAELVAAEAEQSVARSDDIVAAAVGQSGSGSGEGASS